MSSEISTHFEENPELIRPGILCRRITKKDTELTEKEKELLGQFPEIFCYCCCENMVSKVIQRPFASCGRCYCCAGDDPSFDDDEWVDNCVFRYFNIRVDDQGNEIGNENYDDDEVVKDVKDGKKHISFIVEPKTNTLFKKAEELIEWIYNYEPLLELSNPYENLQINVVSKYQVMVSFDTCNSDVSDEDIQCDIQSFEKLDEDYNYPVRGKQVYLKIVPNTTVIEKKPKI